jgi:uncharacterized membrane protein YphA (DoxX/SURF4 family)
MDTVITILQVAISVAFIGGGLFRFFMPYDRYTQFHGQGWANDFQPEHIRLIGLLEAIAGVCIIVPLLLDTMAMLAPLAAVGIALVMSGAMTTHMRRLEYPRVAGNMMWLSFALLVAYDRLVEIVA